MIRSCRVVTQLPWVLSQLHPVACLLSATSSSTGSSSTVVQGSALAACRMCSAAAEPEPITNSDALRAAKELGLDAVPLSELKDLMADAIPQDSADAPSVETLPAKQRRLTYGDVQGYREVLEAVLDQPQTYGQQMPRAPALDAGQWVDTHFKEEGFGFEPRSPFYVWRKWASHNLPPDQYETMVAMEQVMGDDTQRAAMLKQAQHELARLWDWQHRRAALGLSPDLDSSSSSMLGVAAQAEEAAADKQSDGYAATSQAAGSSSEAAAELQSNAPGSDSSPAADAAAAAGSSGLGDTAEATSSSSTAEAGLQGGLENKGVFDILEESGALPEATHEQTAAGGAMAADQFDEVLQSGGGGDNKVDPVIAWPLAVEDVAMEPTREETAAAAASERLLARRLSHQERVQYTLDIVNEKIRNGQRSEIYGKMRHVTGFMPRKYQPSAVDDDLFLPSKPLGNPKIAQALADSSKTLPVAPQKVTRQAVAIAEAAGRAAASTSLLPGFAGSSSSSSAVDGAEWMSMPLLDRTILRQEHLRQQAARLAAKPKRQLHWQLLPLDNYTFDLQQRPPTLTFDLLTSYLEVKYADVLLRKDAVRSIQRQLALEASTGHGQMLCGQDTSADAKELLESPPAALTAAKTLSPAERQAINETLDILLESKQYQQYKEAVLQLYCDNLISWGQLQQCWAAAEAGEELAAAAEAPVTIADDRQQLFAILSGQQQLGCLAAGSSSSQTTAACQPTAEEQFAARKLWEQAGQKLNAMWPSRSNAASSSNSGSSSSSTGSQQDLISYDEARRTWQQVLQIADMPSGPNFEQVLLAGSSSSNNATGELGRQLQQLQQALERATGLSASAVLQRTTSSFDGSSSSSNSGGRVVTAIDSQASTAAALDDLQQLQQLFESAPSLEQALQQQWDQVAREELGRAVQWEGPAWQQLWQLLFHLTRHYAQQQQQQPVASHSTVAAATGSAAANSDGGVDAAALLEKYLQEAEVSPMTPPPYPGARRLLRWEQRFWLHTGSGQFTLPSEAKVKLVVSAKELQEETGISNKGLAHMLEVAGKRYNRSTGLLSLTCDRFPTREENRRWCLEVLHRLLQEAQDRHPSSNFRLRLALDVGQFATVEAWPQAASEHAATSRASTATA